MKIKSIKWLIVSLLLLLLLWLLQQRFSTQKLNPINTISQANSYSEPAMSDRKIGHQTKNKLVEIIPSSTTNNHLKIADSHRSYLNIFRDIKAAESCNNFYKKNHQAKGKYDYMSPLDQAVNHQSRTLNGASGPQKQTLENFVSTCLALKSTVFQRAQITGEFPLYQFAYPVLVELRKEFQHSKPQTAEEKHLAQSILLSTRWQTSLKQLVNVLRGQPKLDKSIRDMMISEAKAIQNQINTRYQSTDVIDPATIQQLEQQIKDLYAQMAERLPVDETKKQQAMMDFDPVHQQFKQLLTTAYPESFKFVAQQLQFKDEFNLKSGRLLNNSTLFYTTKLIPWFQPPSQELKAYAQIDDNQVFNLLIEPASLLYLCYLGDDCSAESAHVRNYCLGKGVSHNQNYPTACGKTLVEFFTADYLSPNQWQDVSTLFDIMVATYAP